MNHLNAMISSPRFEKLRYLILFAALFLVVVTVYALWGSIFSSVIEIQRDFHSRLASHINSVANNPATYGWGLIALSFAYGVFHAVGPGHGKAVIATYLGTHQESLAKGIGISMATALMQSMVAISLVSVMAIMLSFRFSDIDNYGEDMALVSYLLVIILGLVLTGSAIRRIIHLKRSAKHSQLVAHDHGQQAAEHDMHHQDHDHSHHHSHDHHDGDGCCQHAYVPPANQSWLHTLGVIFSIGIRPCSGAIVVLIYAHLVGVFHYGIAATLLMGLGTGITVSAIAVASQYARQWLENLLSTNSGHQVLINPALISISIRLAGGVILVLMGWGLYQTALQTGSGNPLL